MKKETRKNIVIIALILVIMFFIFINLINSNNNIKAKQLISDTLAVQSIISEYIGKMKSNTFDIYTAEQLLIGSTDIENVIKTRIKDNNNEDLLQIVSIENKISKNNEIFYKVNIENFEKEFDIKLYNDEGITWYVKDTGDIKLNYTTKPNWWTQELDAIYLGN